MFVGQWITFTYKGQDVLDIYFSEVEEFEKLMVSSKRMTDNELKINVVSLEDLVEMKKQSGRTLDLADIELIKEFQENI